MRTIAIISAAVAVNASILGVAVTSINAINQHLTVASCKYEAGLSNLNDSYCNRRTYAAF